MPPAAKFSSSRKYSAALFLDPPQQHLYPCFFGPDEKLRPEAREALLQHVLREIPIEYHDKLNFNLIGDGASYNWHDTGDLDLQIWVNGSEEDLLAIRDAIRPVNFPTAADLGLGVPGCSGAMEIQYYAKQGEGTTEENLAQKPYACYDVDTNQWVLKPEPITPKHYGELFLEAEPLAQELAIKADQAIADYERAREGEQYWVSLAAQYPEFTEQATESQEETLVSLSALRAVYRELMDVRAQAYAPTGEGIYDIRDAARKLLEVWNVWSRIESYAKMPVDTTEVVAARVASSWNDISSVGVSDPRGLDRALDALESADPLLGDIARIELNRERGFGAGLQNTPKVKAIADDYDISVRDVRAEAPRALAELSKLLGKTVKTATTLEESLQGWVSDAWAAPMEPITEALKSPPHRTSDYLFRGIADHDGTFADIRPGATIDQLTTQEAGGLSFSEEYEEVTHHAFGFGDSPVIFELMPGAHGINVNAVIGDGHEYAQQKEWLIPGPFRVLNVEDVPTAEASGWSGDEGITRYITLEQNGSSARGAGFVGHRRQAAPKTGVIVALVPPADVSEALHAAADDDAELNDSHITIAYLGDADEVDKEALLTAVEAFAEDAWPVECSVGGWGVFHNDEYVLYASVDIPTIEEWRETLVDYLEAAGLPPAQTHGFTAHLTVRYDDEEIVELPPLPDLDGWVADEVWVFIAGERVSFPLSAPRPRVAMPMIDNPTYDDSLVNKIDEMYRAHDALKEQIDAEYGVSSLYWDELEQTLPTERVPIEDIIPTQTWLNTDKFDLDAGGRSGQGAGPALIYRHDGINFLMDGHHRFYKRWKGDEDIPYVEAHVVDMDDPSEIFDLLDEVVGEKVASL